MSSQKSAEQLARDMLEEAGVEDAQSFTSADLTGISNLIARAGVFSQEDVALLREWAQRIPWHVQGERHPVDDISDRLERLVAVLPR